MAETHSDKASTRYFVAKCRSMDSLRQCVKSNIWASRKRVHPPQPHAILTNASNQGPVILVFSVNNCHGWHGYCQMNPRPSLSKPSCIVSDPKVLPLDSQSEGKFPKSPKCESLTFETNLDCQNLHQSGLNDGTQKTNKRASENGETEIVCENPLPANVRSPTDINDSGGKSDQQESWHYFAVKWHTEFISLFGEACLPASRTVDFFLLDGGTPLNKSRNWQEMSADIGAKLTSLIDAMHAGLMQKRQKAKAMALAAKPLPFLQMERDSVKEGAGKYWQQIVEKVERELGRVHLACPFGSQRYNVQREDSDIDVFIVYQSRTKDMLGFDPPKMTVKNSENDTCDYTVLEVKRYCELLLSYDARCIETLFLHDSTIVQASKEWKQLQDFRAEFLTRKCLDKYLGDALGSNGLQKFNRLQGSESVGDDDCFPLRLAKLAYIIIRLLQNVVNIVKGEPLQVFREEGSEERDVLLKIRRAEVSITNIKAEIQRLQDIIDEKKDTVATEFPPTKAKLESWLLLLRFFDFQHYQFPLQRVTQ